MTAVLAILILFQPLDRTDEWRNLYFQSKNESAIAAFYSKISSATISTSKERAYLGVATAMNASCVSWPGEKLDYFNRGKDLLEQSIRESWNDAEIRFLRFSMQCETPGILGYTSNKSDDLNFIVSAIQKGASKECPYFWKNASSYLLSNSYVNENQKKIVREYADQ
jgi:hypothetical protein